MIQIIFEAIAGFIANLISEKCKENRENKKESQKIQMEVFTNRPELSIKEYKNYIKRTGYGVKKKCDVNVMMASVEGTSIENNIVNAKFCMEDFNSKEWCCVIYVFENVGKTDISRIDIISVNNQNTAIYNVDFAKENASHGILNCSELYDRKIRVGETFSVKICYHKEHILCGVISASLNMGFEDSNGRFWLQPLFAPYDKIYDSRQVSFKEYRSGILPHQVEECFKKPWLW